jgi:hypothetical protein
MSLDPITHLEGKPIRPDLAFRTGKSASKNSIGAGNYDSNYRDYIQDPIFGYEDVDELRAQAQGGKFWRGAARLGQDVVLKFGEGLAHVGGAIGASVTGDEKLWFDNQMVRFLKEMDDQLKNESSWLSFGVDPIYKTKLYSNGNFFDKIGTAEFWGSDFLDGVAFAASAFVPAGLASKAGLIGKAGLGKGLANNIRGLNKALIDSKLGIQSVDNAAALGQSVRDVSKLANQIDLGAITLYNTISESGFEGKDIYDDLISKGVSEEDAVRAAFNTSISNMAALAASNLWEAKMVFGSLADTKKIIRNSIVDGKLDKTKLAQFAPSLSKNLGKNVLKGAAVEGGYEENIQFGIQEAQKRYATQDKVMLGEYNDWLGDYVGSLVTNFGKTDGQTSIFLGALLGSGMSTVGAVRQTKQEQEQLGSLEKIINYSDAVFKSNVSTIYKLDKQGEIIRDANNKPEINQEALSKLGFQIMTTKSLYDEQLDLANRNDAVGFEILTDLIAARYALGMFGLDSVYGEEGLDVLKSTMKLHAEELKKSQPEASDILNKRLEQVDRFFNLFKGIKESAKQNPELKNIDASLQEKILKAQYGEAVRQDSIKRLIQENEARKDNLSGIPQVDAAALKDIDNTNEALNKMLEDSNNNFDLLTNPSKIKELNEKTKVPTFEDIETKIDSKKEEIKTATEESVKQKLNDELVLLENEKIIRQQEAGFVHGIEFNPIVYQYKRPILDVGRNEIERVNDSESFLNEHYFRIGKDHIGKASLNNAFDNYKEGKISLDEVLDIVRNAKIETTDGVYNFDAATRDKVFKFLDEARVLNQQKIDDLDAKIDKVEEFSQEYMQILDEIDNLKNIDKKIADTYEEVFNLSKESNRKKNTFRNYKNSLEFSRAAYGRKIRKEADIIFTEAGQDIENSDYSDYQKINNLINVLNALLDVWEKDGITKNKHIAPVVKQIKEDLVKLELLFQVAIKNKEDRLIKQKKFRAAKALRIYRSLDIDFLEPQQHSTLFNAIEKVLGKEELNKILKEAENAVDYKDSPDPLNPIYGEIILYKLQQLSKDSKKEIEEILKAKITFIEGVLSESFEINKGNGTTTLNKFINDVGLFNLVQVEAKNDKSHPYFVFLKDNDPYSFLEALKNYKDESSYKFEKDTILEITNTILDYISTLEAYKQITSDFNINDLLLSLDAKYNELKEENDKSIVLTPGIQQEIVINQFLKFFDSQNKSVEFGNFAYLKGIAGTGKSTIASKWISDILKMQGKIDEVIVTAATENATKNISQSIHGDNTKGIKLEDIKTYNFDPEKKYLIIIDEANAINLSQKPEAFQELAKLKSKNITFLLTGDPTQITESQFPEIEFKKEYVNITHLNALSVPYRSDVSSINNAADVFRSNYNKVQDATFEANTSLGNTNAQGVHVVNDFGDIIKNSSSANKVIIVNNQQSKDKYKSLIDDKTQVMTYEEVQGQTFDEVFIDLNEAEKNSFNQSFDTYTFNTAMYTSISRAKNHVVIKRNGQKIDHHVNPKIAVTSTESEEMKVQNEERFYGQLLLDNQIFKSFVPDAKGIVVKIKQDSKPASEVKPEDIKDTVENVVIKDEDEFFDTDDDFEDDTTDDGATLKGQSLDSDVIDNGNDPDLPVKVDLFDHEHVLAFPTKNKIYDNKGNPLVKTGNDVIYVKAKYEKKSQLLVLAKVRDTEDKWALIGIVSEEEFKTDFGKQLLEKYNNAKSVRLKDEIFSDAGVFTIPSSDMSNVILEGKVNIARPLTYIYNKNKRVENPNISDIVNQFVKGYFIKAGLKPSVGKIYMWIPANNQILPNNVNASDLQLKSGIPYLIFETPGYKPQAIRLNARRLKKGDDVVKPILKFIDVVEKLEAASGLKLSTKEFREKLESFKDNFTISQSYQIEKTKDIVKDPNQDLWTELFLLVYGVEHEKQTVTEEEYEASEELKNDYDLIKSKNSKYHKLIGKGVDGKIKYHPVIKINQGEASKALNKIAKANSHHTKNRVAEDPNIFNTSHLSLITRYKEKNKDRVNIKGKPLVGKSTDEFEIFGYTKSYYTFLKSLARRYDLQRDGKPIEFVYMGLERYYRLKGSGNPQQQLEAQQMVKTIQDDIKYLEKVFTTEVFSTEASPLFTPEQLNENRIAHSGVLSLDVLKSAFQFDSNGISSLRGGSYLRLPINRAAFNEKGKTLFDDSLNINKNVEAELAPMVETYFDRVLPTKISVTSKPEEVKPSSQPSAKPIVEPIITDQPVANQPSTYNEAINSIIENNGEFSVTFLNKDSQPVTFKSNSKENLIEEIDMYFEDTQGKKLLTEDRNTFLGTVITEEEAYKIAKRLFPKLKDNDLKFVTRHVMSSLINFKKNDVIGLMKNGTVYVEKIMDGTKLSVHENILRHEIFHKIWNYHLTPQERNQLTEQLNKQYPETKQMNYIEMEEFLAEKFQVYTKNRNESGIIYSLKNLFNRLLNLLGLYKTNVKNIEKFFDQIETGIYAYRTGGEFFLTERTALDIKNDYGSVEMYRAIKNKSLQFFNDIYSRNYDDVTGDNNVGVKFYKPDGKRISYYLILPKKEAILFYKSELIREQKELSEKTNLSSEEQFELDVINKLLSTDNNNKTKIFNEIISELFPTYVGNMSSKKIGYEYTYDDSTLEAISKEEDPTGILNEIKDDIYINKETKLSDAVKDFLLSITGKDPRTVFAITISLMDNIDLDNFRKSIIENVRVNGNTQLMNLIGTNLIEIEKENEVEQHPHMLVTTRNQDIKFYFNNKYDLTGKTESEVEALDGTRVYSYNAYTSKSKEVTNYALFLRDITFAESETFNLSNVEFRTTLVNQWRRAYYRNMFSEIVTLYNSLRELRLKYYEKSTTGNTYNGVLRNSRIVDTNEQVKTKVKDVLNKKFSTEESRIKASKFIAEKKKSMGETYELKLKTFKEIIAHLGLSSMLVEDRIIDSKGGEFNALLTDIFYFGERLGSIRDDKEVKDNVSEDNINSKITKDMPEILENESRFLSELSAFLSNNVKYVRATSAITVDGKKIYLHRYSSHAFDVYTKLVGNKKTSKTPDYLTTDFYKHNIFIGNYPLNTIYQYLDFEGTKSRDNVIVYRNEKDTDWLDRHLNGGFIDELMSRKTFRYAQFLYTVSNKPTTQGMEVGLLNEKEQKQAIKNLILQLRARPENVNAAGYNVESLVNAEILRPYKDIVFANSLSEKKLDKLVENVYEDLLKEGEKLLDKIEDDELPIDKRVNQLINKLHENGFLKSKSSVTTNYEFRNKEKQYKIDKENLREFIQLFFINDYLNSYFLGQLVVGDYAYFKNAEDVGKRLSGAFAPGERGDYTKYRTFNVVTLEDRTFPKYAEKDGKPLLDSVEEFTLEMLTGKKGLTLKTLDEKTQVQVKLIAQQLLKQYSDKGYDMTDGQGFMTEKRANQLAVMYGDSYNVGNVMKPAHYEVLSKDNVAMPVMLKYSSIVLTKELLSNPMFAKLRKLNDFMENKNIDEIVFDSAMKVGRPLKSINIDSIYNSQDFSDIDVSQNVRTLNNSNYRLQFNPSAKIDSKKISKPSQILYLISLFGHNDANALKVYQAISKIIDLNLENDDFYKDKSETKDKIKNSLKDVSGSERIAELLNYVDPSFPLVSTKSVIQLSSIFDSAFNTLKFSGSKLVLQTSEGTEFKGDRLRYRLDSKGNLYAEVILPKELESVVGLGTVIGFRIPSTEIHSAVPMKVVGFHSGKSNTVIAPAELVALHGSDFDVDSLFMLRFDEYGKNKSLLSKEDLDRLAELETNYKNYNTTNKFDQLDQQKIEREFLTSEFNQSMIERYGDEYDEDVAKYGWGKRELPQLAWDSSNKMWFETKSNPYYDDYINLKESNKVIKPNKKVGFDENGKFVDLSKLNEDERNLILRKPSLLRSYYKNLIINELLDIIQQPGKDFQVRKRMISPITTERLKRIKSEYETSNFALDLSNIIDRQAFFKSNFDGAALVGIFANSVKLLSYLYRGDQNRKPMIDDKYELLFNGKVYNNFQDIEREGESSVWETFDSLINTSIDNVKDQILSYINASGSTANAYTVAIATGIPLEDIVKFFNQPLVKEITRKKISFSLLNGFKSEVEKLILSKLTEEELKTFTFESLGSFYNYDNVKGLDKKDIRLKDLSVDELKSQYAVLIQYQKMATVGEKLFKLTQAINVINELPVFEEDIDNLNDIMDEVFTKPEDTDVYELKEEFPIKVPLFFEKNPHILSHLKVYDIFKNTLENVFIRHHENITTLITRQLEYNGRLNTHQVRSEIMKFIISFDPLIQEVDSYEAIEYHPGKFISGRAAWAHNFVNNIFPLIENTVKNNKLLEHLSIENGAYGIKKIFFNQGNNLDIADQYEFEEAFKELSKYVIKKEGDNYVIAERTDEATGLDTEFLRYSLITDGSSFGIRNYSSVIPGSLLADVSTNMLATFEKIKDNLLKYRDIIDYNIVMNNADSLNYLTNEKIKSSQGTNYGIDGDIQYSLKFENNLDSATGEYSSTNSDFPRFVGFTDFENKKKVKIYRRINNNLLGSKFIYYELIGNKQISEVYRSSENFFFSDHFDGSFQSRVKDLNTTELVNNPFKYEKGDVIYIYTDNLKQNGKYVIITNIKESESQVSEIPNYTYEVKETVLEYKNELTSDKGLEDYHDFMSGKHDGEYKKKQIMPDKIKEEFYPGLSTQGKLIYDVISKLFQNNLTVKIENVRGNKQGSFGYDKNGIPTVRITNKPLQNLTLEQLLLHELTHASLSNLINSYWLYKKGLPHIKLSKTQKEALDNLYKLHLDFSQTIHRDPIKYGSDKFPDLSYIRSTKLTKLEKFHEFVSEMMTSKDVQNIAKKINNLTAQHPLEVKTNIFKEFFNTLMKLFGFKSGTIAGEFFKNVLVLTEETDSLIKMKESYKNSFDIQVEGEEQIVSTEDNTKDEEEDEAGRTLNKEFYDTVEDFTTRRVENLNKAKEIVSKLEAEHKTLSVDKDASNEQLSTYNSGKYNRTTDAQTGFISHFLVRKSNGQAISSAEAKANHLWDTAGKPAEYKQATSEFPTIEYNKKEYIEAYEKYLLQAATRGKLIHKQLEKLTSPVSEHDRIDREVKELMDKSSITQTYTFSWLNERDANNNIVGHNILKMYDLHVLKDNFFPEITVKSDLLGYAGTIDNLILHQNGTFSLIDFKTGAGFNNETFSNLLKYGDRESTDVTDNQRQRAKLQLMFYAFMLKLENPEMQFRDLRAIWIPGKHMSNKVDHRSAVEISTYLKMIEQYYKIEQPDLYKKIIEKNSNVFKPSEYVSETSTIDKLKTNKPAHIILAEKQQKLSQLIKKSALNLNLETKTALKVEAAELAKQIHELSSDPKLDLNFFGGEGISFFSRWLATYEELGDPILQNFKIKQDEAFDKVQKEYEQKEKQLYTLLLPIYNSYLNRTGKKSISTITRNMLVDVVAFDKTNPSKSLYGFAFKKRTYTDDNSAHYYDLVTEKDQEWNALQPEEKTFLKFVQDEFEGFLGDKGMLDEVVTYSHNGRPMTNRDLINYGRKNDNPFKHTRSFYPRAPITKQEANQKYPLFSAEYWKYFYERHLTMFYEDVFEMQSVNYDALPIKYLGNDYIINNENFSYNIEQAFSKFMRNMIVKKHLDPIYAYGKGLQYYYDLKSSDSKQHKNASEFLRDKLMLDIQDRKYRDVEFFKKKIKIPTTRETKDGKIIQYDKSISLVKVLLGLRNFSSASIMWLMPLNGIRNGIFINMLTTKRAVSEKVASSVFGVSNNNIDFELADLRKSWKDTRQLIGDMILNKQDSNKLFLLAKKLGYLPDNYYWTTNSSELLTVSDNLRTLPTNPSLMYWFHTMPEELNAMIIMGAQMHNMKLKDGSSLWDHYKVVTNEQGISTVEWDGTVRGIIKTKEGSKELTELDARETRKLKRVYQEMHGGYRREERTAMEAYIFGEVLLQFRKYVPALLKSILGSKRTDASIGKYVFNGDPNSQQDYIEWMSRVNEGRWRILLKHLVASLGHGKLNEYRFNNMDDNSKKMLIDTYITFSTFAVLLAASALFFGDADDDDSFKKYVDVIIQNYSQTVNPMDIGRNFITGPASWKKSYEAVQAYRVFSWNSLLFLTGDEDALTQDGVIKGWINTKRSLPYFSSVYSFQRFFENAESLEEVLYYSR